MFSDYTANELTSIFVMQGFSGLILFSVFLLMALGLAIIFGQMGIINMAHGEFMILGAYVTYLTSELFSSYFPTLFSGYFFGFGLEAYRFEGTSKGMFQGGNPVSILNLVFFTYFLLDGNLRKRFIPVLFTVFSAFIIASKSVFGFIFPIFL